MYNFDEIIPRHGTDSFKWDCTHEVFGRADILPMWVSDMDFRCPPPLLEALKKRIDHGILGYTSRSEGYVDAVTSWLARRFDWQVNRDWITYCSPGVLPAVHILIDILSQPDDKIMIQTPNYTALLDSIRDSQRLMVENPLVFDGEHYHIDFAGLKAKLDRNVKLLLLCSPNNPTGEVWQRDELMRLGEICAENGVFVISDEVHSDLTHKGRRHIPFGSLPENICEMSATCISPNKAFNVGGLLTSTIIIPNSMLKERYEAELGTLQIKLDNVFGRIAVEELYGNPECERWLEELLVYIGGNLDMAVRRINATGRLKTRRPGATYLLWIDFSGLNMTDTALRRFLVDKVGIGLSDGLGFGTRFGQFMRMNVGCPRAYLEEALDRLEKAIAELGLA